MLKLRVKSVTCEADGIRSYELVDPAGADLPTFTAGAHVIVRAKGGRPRSYSLCDGPAVRRHYQIAVLNVVDGRGGSRHIHDTVRAGDMMDVAEPRNLFPLAPEARHHLLLAGGIGVTPMMSMIEELRAQGQSFELHYCTTTAERTAFRDRLAPEIAAGRVKIHHDGGDPKRGLDIAALLAKPATGTHVYYCGPAGFMRACEAATRHWPAGAVHLEHFGTVPAPAAPSAPPPPETAAAADEIVLARSGRRVKVPPGEPILIALRNAGIEHPSSCEAGVCGTCRTRYTSGRLEHHDLLLSEDERKTDVLICCARIAQGPVVLDI